MRFLSLLVYGVAIGAAGTAPLNAQFLYDSFLDPSFAGAANTGFSQWDNFYRANGVNLPDVDAPFGDPLPAGTAGVTPPASTSFSDPLNPTAFWDNRNPTIMQIAGGAFIVGPDGGNIYSFSNATAFRLDDTTAYTLGTVVFQFQTEGRMIDWSGLRLVYSSGGGIVSLAPAQLIREYRASGSAFGGIGARAAVQWNLTGLNLKSYQIVWAAQDSSLSFQRALLDTASVSAVVVPRAGTFTGAGSANWSSSANWAGALLPEAGGNAVFAAGALLTLDSSRTVGEVTFNPPGNFTLSASGSSKLTINTGFTVFGTKRTEVTAPVIMGGFDLMDVAAGATLRLSGVVSGNFGFEKLGAGTLELAGNNTFLGGVTLAGGTLDVSGVNLYTGSTSVANGALLLRSNALNGSGALGHASDAVLLGEDDSTGTDAGIWLVGNRTMARAVAFAGGNDPKRLGAGATTSAGATYSGAITLALASNTVFLSTTAATDIVRFSNSFAGGSTSQTLTVSGPGLVIFNGTTKTYDSATTIQSGALQLAANTSFTGVGPMRVSSGGRLVVDGSLGGGGLLTVSGNLSGAGNIARTTTIAAGGVLNPGNGVGNLSFGGSLTLSANSAYRWELQNSLLAAGVGWDLLRLGGNLSLAGTADDPVTLYLATLNASGQGGAAAGFDPGVESSWLIAEVLESISASGTGYFKIDAAGFANLHSGTFYVTVENSGHAVMLHYTTVPEPAVATMLGGGVALACLILPRRKSSRS